VESTPARRAREKGTCMGYCGGANWSFTSLPRAPDTGGENLYIDTKDVQKLLIVGDSAVRLLTTLGARSAWRKAVEKDCPTANVLPEAKSAALHPNRYQSSLSRLSTKRAG
jgi:hypothetical protein